MTWPKVCPCCGERYASNEWRALSPLGIQSGFGLVPDADTRNCACGTTMLVDVDAEDPGPFDHEADVREPEERMAL